MKRREFLKGTLAALAGSVGGMVIPGAVRAMAAGQITPVAPPCQMHNPTLLLIDIQYDFCTPKGGVLHVGRLKDESARLKKWLEVHKDTVRPMPRLDDVPRLADLNNTIHQDHLWYTVRPPS